ncbi:permease for cytosine/purines, uracil, thiamine, allantoin-domain-containing protein [Microdochium trichocladiopsis]|uniref:Permease for cytosine/purines, uracil, thiamine, allantoin-domain-containing protein n=1 Tax=Microdochium trichocladiopsis TaxID=1682393 RepID=A0A9P8XXN1_9PEZI|nr:permease for cytosine/purines, uracil, thiamine, allantoin-domain-containing protein [Microdochium trichocladiopsis]KAH7025154.1 permease for cytosine/purines, uracil, thiamine, allantoin-domain-containing protein [Microdochium trichocladiopsis]
MPLASGSVLSQDRRNCQREPGGGRWVVNGETQKLKAPNQPLMAASHRQGQGVAQARSCPFPSLSSSTTSSQPKHQETTAKMKMDNYKAGLRARFKMDPETVANGSRLTNWDLEPIDEERRNWNWKTYASYWISESWSVTQFTIGAQMVVSGLLWWHALIACAVAHLFGAAFAVFNCRSGAAYHIAFPVAVRACFGVYGGLWPVFSRSVLDLVWYGIQCTFGGTFIDVAFVAIFGDAWKNIPNALPASASITTRGMTAFFLYWVLQSWTTFYRPNEMKWMYYAKSVLMPINMFGLFICAMIRSGGPGDFQLTEFAASRAALAWAMLAAVNSALNGNFGPLVASGQDITRFARSRRDATIGQAISAPWSATVVVALGLITAACSRKIYGEAYWSPALLLEAIMEENFSGATRFACLVSAVVYIFGNVCTNYIANIVPFGSDATALWPRRINYIRATVICAAVGGWLMVPWKVSVDGAAFVNAVVGMGIFVATLIGVMLSDYYVIRKGNYFIEDLYSTDPKGRYYYTKGFNLRAYAAYVVGVAIQFPGFLGTLGVTSLAAPLEPPQQIYTLGYLLAFATAFVVYTAICLVFPDAAMKEAGAMKFEELSSVGGDSGHIDIDASKEKNMAEV